jgi:uncharacterized membrane protein YphA (DoxX/SURF4 family)
MKKGRLILSWTLRGLISLGFLMASTGKLSNNPVVIQMFEGWGYPEGFHFLIGIIELILAVLLLIPKTLRISIIGISMILIGAAITHLINDPILELIRPSIFAILLGVVYFLHFRRSRK